MNVLDSTVSVACWSCSATHDASLLFCPHCGKIQPAVAVDYFSALGLEQKLNIDLTALEQEFHRLSRKLHPDRFARASDREKEWSLADTALLNDAYRTLKDPLRRTHYLLKLNGEEIGEEFAGANGKDRGKGENGPSRAPADLLEEVFELNMQLEEMRMSQKMNEKDPELEASLIEAKTKFDKLLDAVDEDLRRQWKLWDNGDTAARKTAQNAMVALLDRRRYLSNLVRDVNEVLGV